MTAPLKTGRPSLALESVGGRLRMRMLRAIIIFIITMVGMRFYGWSQEDFYLALIMFATFETVYILTKIHDLLVSTHVRNK